MITATIKASFGIAGQVAIKFGIDIPDHYAREILDAVGTVLNDKWAGGKVERVEKEDSSLTRKAGNDLDQETIPLDPEPKETTPGIPEIAYDPIGESPEEPEEEGSDEPE